MDEIWKDIAGYEGHYQVSNNGRVKSLERTITRKNGRPLTVPEKIRSPYVTQFGYEHVTLSLDGHKKGFSVHQLVAIAFLNHTPSGHDMVVDHIDFDKRNNGVSNLRIISQRENLSHKKLTGSSQYTGVHYHKNRKKWCASITHQWTRTYLGDFPTEIEAFKAYKNALNKIKNG